MPSSEALPTTSFLQRISAGDAAAVDECLQQYGGLVWSLAKRYCRTVSDAEDASQEIFLEIWRCADRFDPARSAESTFIATIARRRLIDRTRRGSNAPEVVSMSDQVVDVPNDDCLADPVELSDEAAKAARCMRKLSKDQRIILSMSIDRGESQSAIALALDMPLGTVKSYARRGLLQLRECMKRPMKVEAAS